jgi:hypothetical protein
MKLSSRFGYNATSIRKDRALTPDEIRQFAPSIFAEEAHESRSERYTYIPTSDVLAGLQKEGFSPFMVCQTRVRNQDKREHTKHMIRLRHPSQIAKKEANEIILLNSHDGSSSYQMMGGMLRFVCQNSLVIGNNISDVRIPHKGDVVSRVIEGAFTVLDGFEEAEYKRDSMSGLVLNRDESEIFARAALELRYDENKSPAPITPEGLLMPRRFEDRQNDLWTTFNRVQENLIKGGIDGRNKSGKKTQTRAVTGIDQNTKLNRALWILAEGMKAIKS